MPNSQGQARYRGKVKVLWKPTKGKLHIALRKYDRESTETAKKRAGELDNLNISNANGA